MNASLLAVLNDAERLLVAQTERAELAALDEDAAIEFEGRIRRVRNKYVGQYRRAASARVAEEGGRGKARPENQRALMKAEAFEEAQGRGPDTGSAPGATRTVRPATAEPGDRAPRSPATEMRRATTRAAGARQQAKRDSR
jgi:hypothetical protein